MRSGWNQVNFIYSKKGVKRGCHYHRMNNEAFYIISGKIQLQLESLLGDEEKKIVIEKDKFFKIPLNVIHSFNFLEDTLLISMYDRGVENYDGTKDIYV